MTRSTYVVIMAGGIGSRFWPYSRNSRPKQFIDVLGTGKSLLQMTYERFLKVAKKENILVVTNDIYGDLVKEQIPEISWDQILLEPNRRNTAPCIAYASYKIKQKDPGALMLVTPADHAIFKEDNFNAVVSTALEASESDDKLITIGIQPNRPETGYGYIQYIEDDKGDGVKKVKTFTEKPDIELARTFIDSGDFVWNAGIFVWSVKSIIKAFEDSLSDVADAFEHGTSSYYTEVEGAFVKKAYSQCRNISIDYGIMEKASNVYVVMGDFEWSDLGSWNSLHELREKDDDQNVVDAEAILYDCKNNYVKAEKDKLVVLQGLEGYLVANFDDVLLVCEKDNETKFRDFVNEVKSKKGDKYL
ncbi:MAG: mannose-1-phosphate guanylyltransferase [Cyclobacteriaceae bacterium]